MVEHRGIEPLSAITGLYPITHVETCMPRNHLHTLSDAHGNFYTRPMESPIVNTISFRD